mmetsp:Transcript_9808/g.13405  ORF Transcript_9808/g.13405 Transcript_9808/m.13405 type:complete len:97 (-) Transcript_9808:196-486(-)
MYVDNVLSLLDLITDCFKRLQTLKLAKKLFNFGPQALNTTTEFFFGAIFRLEKIHELLRSFFLFLVNRKCPEWVIFLDLLHRQTLQLATVLFPNLE